MVGVGLYLRSSVLPRRPLSALNEVALAGVAALGREFSCLAEPAISRAIPIPIEGVHGDKTEAGTSAD